MKKKTKIKIERVEYSKRFDKQHRKTPIEIKSAYFDRLELFLSNSSDPLLRNHPLVGKYKGLRSINVTHDWRAIFRELKEGSIIRFEFLGTHEELYGQKN